MLLITDRVTVTLSLAQHYSDTGLDNQSRPRLYVANLWTVKWYHKVRASFKHGGLLLMRPCSPALDAQPLRTLLQRTPLMRLAVRSHIRSTHSAGNKPGIFFSMAGHRVDHADPKTDTVPSGSLLQQLPTEQSNRKWFAFIFSLFHWVCQGQAFLLLPFYSR